MKLETERLILRKPKVNDIHDHHEGINDINISRHLLVVKYPYSKKDSENWIKKCIRDWKKKEKKDYRFFIELKSENKMIGVIDVSVDFHNQTGFTGSWINKKYQKKGYMTEAKIAVNNFAFEELNLRKLNTSVYKTNKASEATQRKMGYKYEGIRRKNAICKATGKIHDEILFGLLKPEWKKIEPKLKKEMNKNLKEKSKK